MGSYLEVTPADCGHRRWKKASTVPLNWPATGLVTSNGAAKGWGDRKMERLNCRGINVIIVIERGVGFI